MKRISIFAIGLLLVVADIAAGRVHYHGFWYPRVHWSIHAHGLVPYDLRYSPYAHTYGHSGLVPYWVRYSPYAHTYQHPTGLVNDYACSMTSTYYCPGDIVYRGSCGMDSNPNRTVEDSGKTIAGTKQTREVDLAKISAQREELRRLAQSRKQERFANRSNGKQTIMAYLEEKNIDFRMSRLLSIEGSVLSADFVLGDGRTVLSYWNPAEIQALSEQAGHRMLLYQNYVNAWKDFCTEYQRAGGEIFQIVSSDREEILAKLTTRDELDQTQTTYAKAQSEHTP